MAKLIEKDEFTEEVYQLEVTDFVEGGENGVDNKPHKALADRTRWLKNKINAFLAGTGLTKAMVGLSNVDNTADLEKPISIAMQEILDSFVGQIAFFAMETAPSGWLKANGALLNRTTYAVLFAKIGTIFGVGDGSTTFRLPDLRGEFIRAWDDGRGVDAGRSFMNPQGATAIRGYSDVAVGYPNLFAIGMRNTDGTLVGNGSETDTIGSDTTFYISNIQSNTGSGDNTSYNVRPRNIAMLACIKY